MPQHIWSKVSDLAKYHEPEPGRLGPVHAGHALQRPGLRPRQEPELLAEGLPRIPCLERLAATSNDAALLQHVNGQADWSHNFVPERRGSLPGEGPGALPQLRTLTTALPVGLFFDLTKYPYSIVGFRKGVSQAIDRNDGVEAR